MIIIQGFKMAIKSIFLSKVRSILTMLGIIIGVAAVITLVSVVQVQNREILQQMESRGTNRVSLYAYSWWGGDTGISDELYDYCMSLGDLVVGVSPAANVWNMQTGGNEIRYLTNTTANHPTYWNVEIYLGNDQYSLVNNFQIARGRDIAYLDVATHNQVVVLGWAVKEHLFPYRDAIGEKVLINGQVFEVIGVYAQKDFSDAAYWSMDYMAVMPHTMSRLMINTNDLNNFSVKASSGENVSVVIGLLEDFLAERIPPEMGMYYVYSESEWISTLEDEAAMMGMVLGGIAGISLLVGGIGIMNIMLVTVRERTREIGIRKAIGGSRKTILAQFLIESAVVCGAGGALGVLIGFLATVVAAKIINDILLFPEMPISLGAFAFSVVLGVGFGMYPAIKASGLQPVEALRSE